MFGFLKPPAHVAPLSAEEVKRKYPLYRLRMFLSVFFGYASYYLTRSNFALAAPHLIKNLGYSIADIGNVRACLGLAYGLSKFFMGIWSDRSNPRYFMSIGLIISGVINFFFPYAASLGVMFLLMFANGWVQGMGWPPAGRTMTHWFSVSERGTKMADLVSSLAERGLIPATIEEMAALIKVKEPELRLFRQRCLRPPRRRGASP